MKVKVSGHWKDGRPWVKVSGHWKKAVAEWVKVSGHWKRVAYEVDHVTITTRMEEIKSGFHDRYTSWNPVSLTGFTMNPSDYPLAQLQPTGRKDGNAWRAGEISFTFDDNAEGHAECARLGAALQSGKASVTVEKEGRPTSAFRLDSTSSVINVTGNTIVRVQSKHAESLARVYDTTGNDTLKVQIDYKE